MTVTACNINVWTNPKFKLGGPCNPDPALRRAALDEILKGVEICKLMKIPVLSVWPGSDGADYHFQIDYKQQIEWFTEALIAVNKECLKHGVKLGIEPKPYEPRELFMIVPTAASAILVAQKVNQACGGNNCGLTIDYGHQKMEATTASTACDLAEFAGVPVHKFDVNDARQGRNDQDLMFGTISIPESVEYLYTTFVRNYQGWYSQDQFTYREDPTRAIERSMINFANLSLKAVRICAQQPAARQGPRAPAPAPTSSTSCRRSWSGDDSESPQGQDATSIQEKPCFLTPELLRTPVATRHVTARRTRSGSTSARTPSAPSSSIRRTDASSGRACSTIRAATRACCSTRSSRTSRGRIPPTTSTGCASSVGGALTAADAEPGFSRDRVIGIGVDTTGSTPLPVDARARPLALDPTLGRATSRRTRGSGRTTRRPREAAAITETARAHAPELLAPIGGTYSSEWWWSKIWRCLKVAPDVFDAAASWVELADFVPAVLVGRRRLAADRPLRLRRGTQGDVLGGVGRPAAEGVPRAARSEARRRCAIGCTTRRMPPGRPAGHLSDDWARDARPARRGSPIAMGGFDAHYGAVGSGIRTGTLVKIIGTSTCDCAIAPVADKIADIPGICGIVNGSIMPGYYGIEAGQSAVGDLLNWWVDAVCCQGGRVAARSAVGARPRA